MTHPTPTSPQASTVEDVASRIDSAITTNLVARGEEFSDPRSRREVIRDELQRTISLLTRPSDETDYKDNVDAAERMFKRVWSMCVDRSKEPGYDVIDVVRKWMLEELRFTCITIERERTRPSVDEEFVLAAMVLRSSAEIVRSCLASGGRVYEAGVEMLERDIHGLDAALASVEGKAAQPTALDERHYLSRQWNQHMANVSVELEELKRRLTTLELAQASEAECNACHGSGHTALSTDPTVIGVAPCWLCNGRGKVKTLTSLYGTLPPETAVKGEAVASWIPSEAELDYAYAMRESWDNIRRLISQRFYDECKGTFMGRPFGEWIKVESELRMRTNCTDMMQAIERLSQRAPRVDVRRLFKDFAGGDTWNENDMEAMEAALAKQSIPTAEVKS